MHVLRKLSSIYTETHLGYTASAVEHDRRYGDFLTASRKGVAENLGSTAEDAVSSSQVNLEAKVHHRYWSWTHRIVFDTSNQER